MNSLTCSSKSLYKKYTRAGADFSHVLTPYSSDSSCYSPLNYLNELFSCLGYGASYWCMIGAVFLTITSSSASKFDAKAEYPYKSAYSKHRGYNSTAAQLKLFITQTLNTTPSLLIKHMPNMMARRHWKWHFTRLFEWDEEKLLSTTLKWLFLFNNNNNKKKTTDRRMYLWPKQLFS